MKLNMSKLYILSGVSGSGKSSFTKQLPKELVISSDNIRENLIGNLFSFNTEKKSVRKRRSEDQNNHVFEILRNHLEARMKERLTTFIDATNLSDKERSVYVKMAKEYNVQSEILIFDDIEQAFKQNKEREHVVPDESMEKQKNKFEPTSRFEYRIVNSETKIELIPNEIPEDIKLDIVGDVHGLYSEIISFMEELGYNENGSHPENRKLLFLGDFVDRGLQSVEMIRLIKRLTDNGHYAIMGNHEEKLLTNAKRYAKGDQPKGSHAVLATFADVVKEKDYEALIDFLKGLPAYYIQGEYAFSHANMTFFSPLETPYTELIYGTYKDYSKRDADQEYDELYKDGINKYILIRGHIPSSNEYRYVYSLEREQAIAGHLAVLSMDKIKGYNFKKATSLYKVDFNYKKIKKMNSIFDKLIKEKLVVKKEYTLLNVVKYHQKVFYDALWESDPLLLKARGLVLDFAGNVIVHSFDKIFNYLENGAGKDIKDDEVVYEIEKLNGFLGNISLNPYDKKLLFSTTGSIDSPFAKMIEEMLPKEKVGKLYKFFSQRDLTLSFEVIHPEDPHIIKYDKDEMGLVLIGARTKGFNDKSLTEEEVDLIAEELGFRRATYRKTTFGEVKNKVKSSNIEGYMVRKDNEDQDFIIKFKTPYYLTTKFLGRMGEKKIKFMFANPKKFKETIDEEFYGIVDSIVSSLEKDKFTSMPEQDKMTVVRELINKERS